MNRTDIMRFFLTSHVFNKHFMLKTKSELD